MADFTAARLERLAASAYDLVANAFLGEPSALGLQGQKLEPLCTEPFCGGFYWEEGPGWAPDAAPPLPAMPSKGQGAHPPGLDVDAAPPPPRAPSKRISDGFASRPLDKLDLTGAKVYLPLDKPIATRVKLLPANKDEWPWWMDSGSVKLLLGVDKFGEVDTVLGKIHRDKLLDHLTPLLRMDDDVMVEGKRIPKGSQLLTVKPFRAPLRVAPWIGSREQLKRDVFPVQLTFGAPKQFLPEGGQARPPPLERPIEEPVTVPVKRLDVVLKRPRDGLKDFLPPLLTARLPEMDSMEDVL